MANGNGKKKKKKIILVSSGIAAAILAVLILIAAKSGGTVIDKSKIGEVKRETLAKNVVATGKITPITKAAIKSKASGIVKKWYKDAGEAVKAGDVLVDLDKEEILTRVHQAEADLQGSEASASAAQADVSRAQVDAEGPDVPLLKRNYERAQQMAKEGVFSQSQLEDAQKNYALALNKQKGATTFNTAVGFIDPRFDTNDLGYMSRADVLPNPYLRLRSLSIDVSRLNTFELIFVSGQPSRSMHSLVVARPSFSSTRLVAVLSE